jgi:hypothetical protein
MKIGIDARICSEAGYYPAFVGELIEHLVELNTEHTIKIYTSKTLPLKRRSLLTDIQERKVFEKEKFSLMIFFDEHVPVGYKGQYIVILESLKEVFFPKHEWLHRHLYAWKLKKTIAKAQKVYVLDGESAMELNEQLNISEEKIGIIPGFFPRYQSLGTQLEIDIKIKHNLRGDYLIYDSGNEVHNNFDRILKALKITKDKGKLLYLIILCDATSKDIDIRNTALEYGITQQILFIGSTSPELERAYYTQSKGVIFSSIYESFPLSFTKALSYGCHIFANNIPAHKTVMEETISYLDPLSVHTMSDTLFAIVEEKQQSDYSSLRKKYDPTLSAQKLLDIL